MLRSIGAQKSLCTAVLLASQKSTMKSLATHDYFRFNDLPGLRFVSGLPNMKLSTLLCYPFAGLKSKRSSKTMESSRHHLGQTDSLEHPFNDSFLLTSFFLEATDYEI